MKSAKRSSQQGMTLIGLVVVGVFIALAVIVGAKVMPTVTEYMAIQKVITNVSKQSFETVAEAKAAFNRAASVQYISSVKGDDLDVVKIGGRTVIRFAYEKEIPLAGPVYLLIKYSGSSERR